MVKSSYKIRRRKICGASVTMTAHSILALVVLALFGLDLQRFPVVRADRVALRYKINQKDTQCIFSHLEKGDFASFSVYIVESNSGNMKGTVSYDGPIAGNADLHDKGGGNDGNHKLTLGLEISRGVSKWPELKMIDRKARYDQRIGVQNRQYKVDWTHAGESEDAVAMRAELAKSDRNNRSGGRYGNPQAERDKRDGRETETRTIVMDRVEPYEETRAIKAAGWYRLCVTSDFHTLYAHMDIRNGSELGGVDRETGHVITHSKREMLDEMDLLDSVNERALLDSNTQLSAELEKQKELENQVKEQDLHATKAQIKHMNELVHDMREMQSEAFYRLKSHESSARRNYSMICWSSTLETLLYVTITGVQIYTVRKWLLGEAVLGR